MADTYSTNLRLTLMESGAHDSTWGSTLNSQLQLVEAAIAGRSAVTHDDTANYTLTTANGSADEARRMIIDIGGALSAARNAVVPTQTKFYVVKNSTTGGYAVTVKTSGGTGIAVPNGKTMLLFCDGTNVVEAINQVVGTLALTSPAITTSITTPSTTFSLVNTTATTVNFAGAASVALSIGHADAAAAFAGGISIPTGKTLSGAGAINISGNITGAAGSFTTGTFSGKISANAGTSSAAALEIFPAASATAHIIQTGSATNGWKWIQDESTTGDLYWQRRVASVDTTAVTFHRSTGNVTFAGAITGAAISGTTGAFNRNTSSTLSITQVQNSHATNDAAWQEFIGQDASHLSIGQERSTGGGVLTGAGAYEGFVFTSGARALLLGTNGAINVRIASGGVVTINNLAGTGTRAVVVDANGVLSAP